MSSTISTPFPFLRRFFSPLARLRLVGKSPFKRSSTARELAEYLPPPATTEQLEWADLAIIDLSKANTPEGRKTLAEEVVQAMNTQGFFYVINHGYTIETSGRMFSIASTTFDDVDSEEKKTYMGKSPSVYEGYKPRQTWQIEQGVTDQIEQYNINHAVRNRAHPNALRPHLDEIDEFAKQNHTHILFTILRLLAIGMELSEDTFVDMHRFEAAGESSGRSAPTYPRSVEEEQQTNNVWLKGHTDIGSITILWSQPISGLQILSRDGVWRYIKHIENALVNCTNSISLGDVMQLLSGNFYKPTIHRVIQPPKDQERIERLGVFYFAMAADDVKLASVRTGAASESEKASAPTMSDWRKERTERYGTGSMKPSSKEEKVEEEVILGE
ncbi:Clavaminate synthase-like protein [Gymnopus androsaceus JB14]|uniref:Clavaminate synthase-like protein n=1 Tax=Gymnopus androsaceus JB14 TaxID=1447944 RepID=A0A6A4HME1_9AGAR|nr:Clavaminate synthase-like protein [Gymnopus androsaceus JB14]